MTDVADVHVFKIEVYRLAKALWDVRHPDDSDDVILAALLMLYYLVMMRHGPEDDAEIAAFITNGSRVLDELVRSEISHDMGPSH